MKSRKNIALYYRLLKLCALILLPMLCITLAFSQYAIAKTRLQQQERSMDVLSSNLGKVEEELSRIYMALLNLRENTQEIRDISRRYPSRISAFELGQDMNEILSQMTRLSLTSDMIHDMTVHWLGISRAAALSRCYSDSFSDEVQDFLRRAQSYPGSGLIEGPFGMPELFTLHAPPSGKKGGFLLYATLNKSEFIAKLLPVDEGSLAAVIGDSWAILGNGRSTASTQQYVPAEASNGADTRQNQDWQAMIETIRQHITPGSEGSFVIGDYMCFYRPCEAWGFTACNMVRLNGMNRETRIYQALMCLVVLLTLAMLLVARSMLNRSINRPIRALIQLFRQTSQHASPLPEKPADRELGLVYDSFRQMQEELHLTQEHAMAQRIALEKAKYHLLQAQIDPHFLHNCFNIISHCLRSSDTDTAMEMVGYFRKYFRYLSASVQEESTLGDEWTYVETYLNIQQLRFGHLLSVCVEPLDEACAMVRLPRLVVQSLVENVFKHAVNRTSNVRQITLRASMEEGWCIVRVWDNGDGLTDEALAQLQQALQTQDMPEGHVGLKNILERLRWLCPRNDLRLSRPAHGGFLAEIYVEVQEE